MNLQEPFAHIERSQMNCAQLCAETRDASLFGRSLSAEWRRSRSVRCRHVFREAGPGGRPAFAIASSFLNGQCW